jgi:hypothetical protein
MWVAYTQRCSWDLARLFLQLETLYTGCVRSASKIRSNIFAVGSHKSMIYSHFNQTLVISVSF